MAAEVVDDLLSRDESERTNAQVRLAPGGNDAIPAEPSARIDFDESSIGLLQWAPEQTLIQVDR